MLTIPVTGPIKAEALTAPPDPDVLHDLVGGYLELVPYFRTVETENGGIAPCVAFCNEDGKDDRQHPPLPFNPRATQMWANCLKRTFGFGPEPDYLVGTIVVIYGDRKFLEAL